MPAHHLDSSLTIMLASKTSLVFALLLTQVSCGWINPTRILNSLKGIARNNKDHAKGKPTV
jgi:hypothetical protein